MKFKDYSKAVFSKWYFYVIAILILITNLKGQNISELVNLEPSFFIGGIIGSLLCSFLVSLLIYFISRKIKERKK